ncbi:hypothetical protein ABZX77_33910 [Streptomyces sp. NPDC004237]|uniref:hypothetical protein n=1 Tax=Streptomyces sp. NPDC004237 TaxID=3154455 RepID=UPI00339DEED5
MTLVVTFTGRVPLTTPGTGSWLQVWSNTIQPTLPTDLLPGQRVALALPADADVRDPALFPGVPALNGTFLETDDGISRHYVGRVVSGTGTQTVSFVAPQAQQNRELRRPPPDNNLQSGLEILARLLTEPLTDDRYEKLLGPYAELRKTFRGDPAALPGPLHHFRGVLSYLPGKDPVPQYWDVPLGFERAIHDEKHVLLVPLMNGGDGGVLLRPKLDELTANAVRTVYTHGTTLDADSLAVDKPVVMAYSQSGGNAFTSAGNNLKGIGGLVLFEAVYTNEYPRDATNHQLMLGKDVIPRLLKENVKVVVIGRWRDRPRSYLPDGKLLRGITVLPDAADYYLLDYPLPPDGKLGSAHPVVALRCARLVDGKHDKALDLILGSEGPAHLDEPTAQSEAAVEASIAGYRKAGLSDESIVRRVFSMKYLPDQSGAYYLHNLILAGGQHLDAKTKTYRGFIQEALSLFGH